MDSENAVALTFIDTVGKLRKLSISAPKHSDCRISWVVDDQHVDVLIEFKKESDFQNHAVFSKTLAQVTCYLQRFHEEDADAPGLVALVSNRAWVVVPASKLVPFFDQAAGWSNPSTPPPALVRILSRLDHGCYVQPYNENVGSLFVEECEAMFRTGDQVQQALTLKNLEHVFLTFRTLIQKPSALNPDFVIDCFYGCLLYPDTYFVHPKKKSIVKTPGNDLKVKAKAFLAFLKRFQVSYRPSEIHAFVGNRDRLVDEEKRRRQGGFFTPAHVVDFGRNRIASVLDEDWYETSIVYDPACGTGNLTRGKSFSQLLLTTLEPSELAHARSQQVLAREPYDFLSLNPLPPSINQGLEKHRDKTLVVFMNPPYSCATSKKGKHKAGVSATGVKAQMAAEGLGNAEDLYLQFLYRAHQLVQFYGYQDVYFAVYSPCTFLTTVDKLKFSKYWHQNFEALDLSLIKANLFDGVSKNWGIMFSVWKMRSDGPDQTSVLVKLVDANETGELVQVGEKILHRGIEDQTINPWWKIKCKRSEIERIPQFSSGVKLKTTGGRGNGKPGWLAYLVSSGNNVDGNASGVVLTSASCSIGNGCSLTPANWDKAIAVFTVRKLVLPNWINSKDEYYVPSDTSSEAYARWLADAQVWTLVAGPNNAASLRNVEYREKTWSVPNHFFWLTRDQALQLYDDETTLSEYEDAQVGNHDPYLATLLPKLTLGAIATTLLAKLNDLLKASLSMRSVFDDEEGKYQVRCWDAGVYQLKEVWKKYYPEEWSELLALHGELGKELLPGVYKFGFLKK